MAPIAPAIISPYSDRPNKWKQTISVQLDIEQLFQYAIQPPAMISLGGGVGGGYSNKKVVLSLTERERKKQKENGRETEKGRGRETQSVSENIDSDIIIDQNIKQADKDRLAHHTRVSAVKGWLSKNDSNIVKI